MARRKPVRRPLRITRTLPWDIKFEEIFRLAGSEWISPDEVSLSQGASSMTWSADFTDPQGQVFTLKIRLRRAKDGWNVAEETLQTRLVSKPRSAA